MSIELENASWPGWKTVRLIGRGSFGAVYEIERDVFGDIEKAALKVISIPQNGSDIDELYSDGYDEESVTSTFHSHLKSIVAEYSLMRKMNGCTNIVNCDDVRYVQHEDGIGWDIFIKMELLTPLPKALPADVSEETVIQIAKDMCAALELCKKYEIIHRDIKPQNIFVSPNGDYKLGDFGIAKTVEKTTGGTKIGTYKYMAPEVYNNQPYGSGADIYSLGLVLYWLLNERRMPFLPLPPAKLSPGMDEAARHRRLSGEEIPAPKNGSEALKKIVLKTCAYKPEDRYASAAAIVQDLNQIDGTVLPADRSDAPQNESEEDRTIGIFGRKNATNANNALGEDDTIGVFYKKQADSPAKPDNSAEKKAAPAPITSSQPADASLNAQAQNPEKKDPPKSGNKKKLPIIIGAAAAVIVILVLLLFRSCQNSGSQLSGSKPGNELGANSGSQEAVTLSEDTCELFTGDSVTLQPEGGNGTYRYESSNEKVVIINEKGEITAVSAGIATITVRSGDSETTCTVTIQDYEMALSTEELSLFVEAAATLEVSGIPENAEVDWSTDDQKIATVSNGEVTGVAMGSTTVTASWKNGEKTYTASAKVTVETGGITLSTYSLDAIYVGQTETITTEASSDVKEITWESSNPNVATVSADGVVTAVGGGSATITATSGTYSAECTVTVIQPGVSLSRSSVSVFIGESTTLSATVVPSGTSVTWSSDNTNVATVSGGKVTAVGGGSTTIRAKITHSGQSYTATCTVTVITPSVSLSASSISLTVGNSQTLTANTSPSGSSVSWSSSNKSVATVSGGKVTAVAEGSATITAQITYDGKTYKATCSVTVAKPSISVTSSASTIEYSQKDQGICTLTAKVNPDGGSVNWSSSDTSVATVNGSGTTATVTAVTEGSATITATYSISGTTVTDSCTITVRRAASTLTVNNLWCPDSGTTDSFRISGTVTSNYCITRMECTGSATSNALGISVSDTADPLYVGDGVYCYDLSDATAYFINQYKKLYDLYSAAAGLLGADNSVTMNVTGTCYDSTGNSVSFTFTYIIYSE